MEARGGRTTGGCELGEGATEGGGKAKFGGKGRKKPPGGGE